MALYYFTLKFANKYVAGLTVGYTINVASSQRPPAPSDIENALLNAGFSPSDARFFYEPSFWTM